MSKAQLEQKVTDYLSKSQLLADYWHRPLTAEQHHRSCSGRTIRFGSVSAVDRHIGGHLQSEFFSRTRRFLATDYSVVVILTEAKPQRSGRIPEGQAFNH